MSTQTFWNISASSKIPKVRSLPVLLLVSDISSLVVCLEFGFWLRSSKLLNEFNLIVCGLILLIVSVFYLADTYKPDSQIAGLRVPARIILCNAFVAGVSAALIYLSGAWRHNPFLWRSVLLPSLGIFTIWVVISRLWAARWVRSQAQQSRWLVLGAGDSTVKFVRDFLKLNPLGRLVVLAENLENITQLPKSSINGMG
nr:sugar transferase [Aetokthonos hydrillicola CCALA 1050]